MDKLNKIIAENIAFLRATNKMTQLELAEKLNYSDKAVSKWERGESIPDVRVLMNIASLFGVNISYLVEDHGIEELPLIPKKGINLKVVTVMSVVALWTASLLAFIICQLAAQISLFDIFVYTVPVTFVLLLVLNCIWGTKKRFYNFWIISFLWWSALVTVWYIDHSLVSVFWLGLPAQILIALGFMIVKKKK